MFTTVSIIVAKWVASHKNLAAYKIFLWTSHVIKRIWSHYDHGWGAKTVAASVLNLPGKDDIREN